MIVSERALSAELPELLARIEWIDALPEAFDGVILANEVADALPVERFERDTTEVRQLYVRAQGGELVTEYRAASERLSERVLAIEDTLGRRFQPGYRSEVSLGLNAWSRDIAAALSNGMIFVFDYGLGRAEYYGEQRGSGWLRCHFRHHAHAQPLIYPGIQDITCWVDFSDIAEGSGDAGASVAGFVTQAMFLLNGGLDNEFASFGNLTTHDQLELARQVKLLTLAQRNG